MNEVPGMWENDTRLGVVLPQLQEPEPATQWYHKAVEEVNRIQAPHRWIKTGWGWRLKR